MSEVERYKYARTIERPDLAAKAYPPGSKCFETDMCDFVLASDYAALEAERDATLAECERLRGLLRGFTELGIAATNWPEFDQALAAAEQALSAKP